MRESSTMEERKPRLPLLLVMVGVTSLFSIGCLSDSAESVERVDAGTDAGEAGLSEAGEDADATTSADAGDSSSDVQTEAVPDCQVFPASNRCACSCGGKPIEVWFPGDCTDLSSYGCVPDYGYTFEASELAFENCTPVPGACPPWGCGGNTLELCGCSCGTNRVLGKNDGFCSELNDRACGDDAGALSSSGCASVGQVCANW